MTEFKKITPTKRKIAIDQLDEPASKRKLMSPDKTRCDKLNNGTITKIQQFYKRDDIRQMSQKTKIVTIHNSMSHKERLQKRLMIMNLSEGHLIFLGAKDKHYT